MSDSVDTYDELIFAFIDGELNEQECADFELLRASNSTVERRIIALTSINDGIGRLSDATPSQSVTIDRPAMPRRRWISYAAILVITSGLFIYMNPPTPKEEFDAQLVYSRISAHFEPQIVCDTPEKFVEYTSQAFGKRISIDFDTPIQLVGWRYLGRQYNSVNQSKKKTTRILMALSPDGTIVLTAFVPRGLSAPELGPDSSLNIFKQTVQSVRVYEITPLDSPIVLGLLQ